MYVSLFRSHKDAHPANFSPPYMVRLPRTQAVLCPLYLLKADESIMLDGHALVQTLKVNA
jgi:hypothetical protein